MIATLAACKSRQAERVPSDPPAAIDAQLGADANLDGCRAAAARIPDLPAPARAQALLDACRPCGDWAPLLSWSQAATEGGPTRAAIERAMVACHAYCDTGAKQRFLGSLDAARGQGIQAPWRVLGEMCKDAVSAVPDARYMSAPYFALDRIARALGDPAVLAAIELPLPAVSVTGVGLDLPSAPATTSDPGSTALTVYAGQILLGTLPTARLSPSGLAVSGDYPGTELPLRALAARLAAPELSGRPIALLAPGGLAASRIVDVLGAAGGHEVRLAVATPGPGGWMLPRVVPVAVAAPPARPGGLRITLGADPVAALEASRAAPPAGVSIALEPAATTENLARLLGTLAERGARSAVLLKVPGKPLPTKP